MCYGPSPHSALRHQSDVSRTTCNEKISSMNAEQKIYRGRVHAARAWCDMQHSHRVFGVITMRAFSLLCSAPHHQSRQPQGATRLCRKSSTPTLAKHGAPGWSTTCATVQALRLQRDRFPASGETLRTHNTRALKNRVASRKLVSKACVGKHSGITRTRILSCAHTWTLGATPPQPSASFWKDALARRSCETATHNKTPSRVERQRR